MYTICEYNIENLIKTIMLRVKLRSFTYKDDFIYFFSIIYNTFIIIFSTFFFGVFHYNTIYNLNGHYVYDFLVKNTNLIGILN